jgi:hypothetical protein
MTRNVQIIDGADNCTYSIYELTDEEFALLFPAPGQNVEFIEDALLRLGDERLAALLQPVWEREIKKAEVNGIHGTLFYELSHKKKYYPTKNEEEMVVPERRGK